jgi:hypothetical protein
MAYKSKIWELLGRSVKWEEVVRHGPKIVEAARILYETSRQRQQPSSRATGSASGPDLSSRDLAELDSRIRRLEENETEQAALVTDIANQLETLTRSVDALGARVQMLLWLGGGALVVALAALALSLTS